MADVKNLNPDLQDKEPQLSKEELSKRREEITEFYKDNIPQKKVVVLILIQKMEKHFKKQCLKQWILKINSYETTKDW
jgi:hypothetical protein